MIGPLTFNRQKRIEQYKIAILESKRKYRVFTKENILFHEMCAEKEAISFVNKEELLYNTNTTEKIN